MTSDEGTMSDWRFLFSLIVELTLEGQPVSSADPTSWRYFVFDKNSSLDHSKRKVGVAGTALMSLQSSCCMERKVKWLRKGLILSKAHTRPTAGRQTAEWWQTWSQTQAVIIQLQLAKTLTEDFEAYGRHFLVVFSYVSLQHNFDGHFRVSACRGQISRVQGLQHLSEIQQGREREREAETVHLDWRFSSIRFSTTSCKTRIMKKPIIVHLQTRLVPNIQRRMVQIIIHCESGVFGI